MMVLKVTKFELIAFSLLICKFVQEYFCKLYLNLVKEDVIHKNIPGDLSEEDNVHKNVRKFLSEDHYSMIEKIVVNSLLYSTIITGGFLCRDSFENSFNKLLALLLIGSFLLLISGMVSCSYLIYNSLDTMDELLKIFSDLLTFCSELLFFFNMFFKSSFPLALAVFCDPSNRLAVTILSSFINQVIIDICISLWIFTLSRMSSLFISCLSSTPSSPE